MHVFGHLSGLLKQELPFDFVLPIIVWEKGQEFEEIWLPTKFFEELQGKRLQFYLYQIDFAQLHLFLI